MSLTENQQLERMGQLIAGKGAWNKIIQVVTTTCIDSKIDVYEKKPMIIKTSYRIVEMLARDAREVGIKDLFARIYEGEKDPEPAPATL